VRKACVLSIRLYLQSYSQSLSAMGRMVVPLGKRRIAILLLFFPFFLSVQALHWLGFLLDEIFFRGYRKVTVRNPLFITGVPRSGTTFLHRTFAKDEKQFTTFRTWEALLAPSVTEKKLLRGLSYIDKCIGRPLHRLFEALTKKITGEFADIHEVGPSAPEEDYLTLLPAGGCFILALAFPANPAIWALARFQDMPEEDRQTLIAFYKSCMQKHLYTVAPGLRLLSKNAAFASWIPDLRMAFPDSRFIFCIRDPKPTLSSQLSSIISGIRFFATDSALDTFSLEFQTVLAHAYRVLRDEMQSFLPDHLAIIDLTYLKKDSEALLTTVAKRLCLELDESLKQAFREAGAESRAHVSQHKHVPVMAKSGPSEFIACVQPLYEEMILNSVRL